MKRAEKTDEVLTARMGSGKLNRRLDRFRSRISQKHFRGSLEGSDRGYSFREFDPNWVVEVRGDVDELIHLTFNGFNDFRMAMTG